jgi:uncharacterized protein YlbG (UPF0298 family)
MYAKDQLNIDVILPISVDWKSISGLTKAVQVFPDDDKMAYMFVVYVEPDKLESVTQQLNDHPGVRSVERCAIRRIM